MFNNAHSFSVLTFFSPSPFCSVPAALPASFPEACWPIKLEFVASARAALVSSDTAGGLPDTAPVFSPTIGKCYQSCLRQHCGVLTGVRRCRIRCHFGTRQEDKWCFCGRPAHLKRSKQNSRRRAGIERSRRVENGKEVISSLPDFKYLVCDDSKLPAPVFWQCAPQPCQDMGSLTRLLYMNDSTSDTDISSIFIVHYACGGVFNWLTFWHVKWQVTARQNFNSFSTTMSFHGKAEAMQSQRTEAWQFVHN